MSPILLTIETTGTFCSVAIFDGKNSIENTSQSTNSHSSQLHTMIDDLMKKQAIAYPQLSAIVLSKGPGSYTGLRIGSSSAKGLCTALNIPLIAIPSHSAMLYNTNINIQGYDIICCATDARRDEIYLTIFDKNKKTLQDTSAVVLTESNPMDKYKTEKILLIGSGAEKLGKYKTANSTIIAGELLNALNLISPALEKFNAHDFENLFLFEPYYLKKFFTTQKPIHFS